MRRYCVYFIRPEGGGPIKIGLTHDLSGRLTALQIGSPVKLALIARIDGGAGTTEAALHRRFAAGRLHGEWFREDTPGLLELIADILRDDIPEYVQDWVKIDTRPPPPPKDPFCEHKRSYIVTHHLDRPVYVCRDCDDRFYIQDEDDLAENAEAFLEDELAPKGSVS